MQDAMRVPGNRRFRIDNQQAAAHAQVDDPLQAGRRATGEIENNVFAYAEDAFDAPAR
jgi:hypothetical protein